MTEAMGSHSSPMPSVEVPANKERGDNDSDSPGFKVFVGGIARQTDENEIFESELIISAL